MENLKIKDFEYLIVVRTDNRLEEFKNVEELICNFGKDEISDSRISKDFILKAHNGKIKDLKLKEYLHNTEPLLCISSSINKLNFLYTGITYLYNYYNSIINTDENVKTKIKELNLCLDNLYKLCRELNIKCPKYIKTLNEKEMNRLFSTSFITFDPVKFIDLQLRSFILNDKSFVLVSKCSSSLFPLEYVFNSYSDKIGYRCKLLGGCV